MFATSLAAAKPHAQALGCEAELMSIDELARRNGAKRQLQRARQGSLTGLVSHLADDFAHH